ncbi:MAG: formate dehydrogenase accessory sulfurtransferase FdhD, partial [Pseudomonadota bacterium]
MQLARLETTKTYVIAPDVSAPRLTRVIDGSDHSGTAVQTTVVEERPLTIFLNGQEVVTAMTIGDYPQYLALGFLRNQGMLRDPDEITGVDYDEELETVVVRTAQQTDFEEKMR